MQNQTVILKNGVPNRENVGIWQFGWFLEIFRELPKISQTAKYLHLYSLGPNFLESPSDFSEEYVLHVIFMKRLTFS